MSNRNMENMMGENQKGMGGASLMRSPICLSKTRTGDLVRGLEMNEGHWIEKPSEEDAFFATTFQIAVERMR